MYRWYRLSGTVVLGQNVLVIGHFLHVRDMELFSTLLGSHSSCVNRRCEQVLILLEWDVCLETIAVKHSCD